jgi:hypothetical protein
MNTQLIITDTGYYQLARSSLVYLPFQVPFGEQVLFTCAHSNFFKNQNWSVRLWISDVINGPSITQLPQANLAYVSPLKLPVVFGAYDVTFRMPPQARPAVWKAPVAPMLTYYLNIKNMENKDNGFYLTSQTTPIE